MKFYLIILIFLFSILTYGDISKISVYPSGVKVSFLAPLKEKQKEKTASSEKQELFKRKKSKKQKKIKEKEIAQTELQKDNKEEQTKKTEYIKFTKFIRIVNGIKIENSYHNVAILFFDQKNNLIEREIVPNTPKPSPNYIFFIDRNSGKYFQGKLDIYEIPEHAEYFMVGIIDNKNTLINYAENPSFTENNKILITEYLKISPNNKIMLQIELLGSIDRILTRVCAFRFN